MSSECFQIFFSYYQNVTKFKATVQTINHNLLAENLVICLWDNVHSGCIFFLNSVMPIVYVIHIHRGVLVCNTYYYE